MRLEKDGFTDGTLSEDSDLFFYEGSKNLYSGFNTRSTSRYRCVVNRETADAGLAELSGHQLRACASFCGTDYIDHLAGVGKCFAKVASSGAGQWGRLGGAIPPATNM